MRLGRRGAAARSAALLSAAARSAAVLSAAVSAAVLSAVVLSAASPTAAAPTAAEADGSVSGPAGPAKVHHGVRFLKAFQWPTWYGASPWSQSEITPGTLDPVMYCATAPLPYYETRYRTFDGAPAFAVQQVTVMPDEASAAALVSAYLANAGSCSAKQLAKGLHATSTVEPLGRYPKIKDGVELVGVFYHVPAYGFIASYDAMRLYAAGRDGRRVTTIEFWRDGTRHPSRVMPFRELAKFAVEQLVH